MFTDTRRQVSSQLGTSFGVIPVARGILQPCHLGQGRCDGQDTVVNHEAVDVRRHICPCAEIIGQGSESMLLCHQDDSEKIGMF